MQILCCSVLQLSAALNAINDVQFALDNNLIASSHFGNVSALADFLLDGKVPTRYGTYKNEKGESVFHEWTDTYRLKVFQDIKAAIAKKKEDQAKSSQSNNKCIPCVNQE